MAHHSKSAMTLVLIGLCCAAASPAQIATGGTFALDQAVVASGGAGTDTGNTFKVVGAAGQAAAGANSSDSGSLFHLRSGFSPESSFTPTAAGVPISGRILTSDGRGIRNVSVSLTNLTTGEVKIALSSSFGYYLFTDIEAGSSYILTLSAKRYQFPSSPRLFTLFDAIADIDFVATE